MNGFQRATTATLHIIRANLLRGLGAVNDTIQAGTFHDIGPKGSAPPSQSGQLTLALLAGVTAELERRNQCPRSS